MLAQQAELMKEREKEKEQHVKEKATQHFTALLADMVSIEKIDATSFRLIPSTQ